MNKSSLFLIIFIFVANILNSQNFEFSTLLIPKELKEDANSVIRFENTSIELKSQRDMTIKFETAITIFNKLADDYADVTLYYDKRRAIKSVKVIIYDAMGNELEKIKKSDFKDYSATGGSLYSDSRLIHYNYTPTTYPYTVFYTYQLKTSNTAFIRNWTYSSNYCQSIQKATYSFKYPLDIKLSKSEQNFEGFEIKKTEKEGMLSYEIENIGAIKWEPYVPLLRDFLPTARLGVDKFNLEGVDGEAKNWQEFGKWYYKNLIQSRMDLPESTKNEIKKLTLDIEDPIEKTKKVYEYVQDKVRYVSIQVGVGGFEPMLASEVDKLSYGDCKGLTNYTSALLKEVGITSYHALIYGNPSKKLSINSEVVSQQGDHMVLYVPIVEKELWLECTSQNTPFADGGGFTDDRDALVITPNGGEIKHTRAYDDKENHQKIIGKYTLSNQGNINGEIDMVCSGTKFNNHLGIENSSEKEKEKTYKEFWDNINNLTIDKVDIKNNKKEGKFEESITFTSENYGTISGERMIFPVNAFNVIDKAPKRIRNRKLPVEVVRGYYDVDEVEIELPSEYNIEAMSNDVSINTKFGSYTMTIEKVEEKKVKFKREFLLKTGDYSKEEYNDYRNFWKQVVKSDHSKIVLIKN